MIRASKTLLLLLALGTTRATNRSFTDDKGNSFSTSIEKPTIVTFAHTGVSMHAYGLDASQLLGTYGEWINDGSDYDFGNPEAGSTLPADPTAEELEFLKEVINLSPGCGAAYCTEFDIDRFLELDPDFFVVNGYRQEPWAIGPIMANITAGGYPEDRIIYNELSVSNNGEDCTEEAHVNCYGKSMIDVIETYIELSSFLNLETPDSLDQEMKDLCSAATTFSANMKIAQEKGLRVMPAYLSTGTSYFAHATDDMVLRMLEELGMPIMHPGSCPDKDACVFEYFWEWIPIGEYFQSCTDEEKENLEFEYCSADPLYPVDYWLYDHRTSTIIDTEDFKIAFPDQAIKAGSIGMWPIGGRKITPGHAAQILNNLGEDLATTDRIYDQTACTLVDVSSVSHRTNGLDGGEYACWDDSFHNLKYFQNCHADDTADITEETSPKDTADTTESTGETPADVAAKPTTDVAAETPVDVAAKTSADVAAETSADAAAKTSDDAAAKTSEDVTAVSNEHMNMKASDDTTQVVTSSNANSSALTQNFLICFSSSLLFVLL